MALTSCSWVCLSISSCHAPRGQLVGAGVTSPCLGCGDQGCAEASPLARKAVPALRTRTQPCLWSASTAWGSRQLPPFRGWGCSASPSIRHRLHGSIPPPCSACSDACSACVPHPPSVLPSLSRSLALWGEGTPCASEPQPGGTWLIPGGGRRRGDSWLGDLPRALFNAVGKWRNSS